MINLVKRLLPKGKFVRGVSVLVGGTTSAQAMLILASPLLTRLYTPEDFGLLAVYAGLLALFSVVASLRYELAIPLPESDEEAASIVILSLITLLFMTFISALMLIIAGDSIAEGLGVPELANYFWLLPIGVFFMGGYNICKYWAIRAKAFSDVAVTRISQSIGMLAVQILGFKLGSFALLLGQALGHGIGGIRLTKLASEHEAFKLWNWSGVLYAAKRYKQFPIFSTWGALFNTAGTQLPPILFASLFSGSAAGIYTLAHRVLAMPMSVIGEAVSKVFFANAAEAHRANRLGSLISNIHIKLAEIAIPLMLLLVVAGPFLFTIIFGDKWGEAGLFARYMAPWLYMVFITSPLSTLFSVLERERAGMIFQTTLLIARIAVIFVGAKYFDSIITTVALFSITSALFWLGFLIWMLRLTNIRFLEIFSATAKPLALASICVAPLYISISFHADSTSAAVIGSILTTLSLIIYYFILARRTLRFD